jgi:hypothetical protein
MTLSREKGHMDTSNGKKENTHTGTRRPAAQLSALVVVGLTGQVR